MSEYPKTLYHPAYSAGTPAKPLNAAQLAAGEVGEAGVPCRYAPVTVKNAKDEDYHRSMGYMAQEESHIFAQYADYPKMMIHPEHVDGVPEGKDAKRDEETNAIIYISIPAVPEKFPHAFVNNPDEEEAWRAKGYELPGIADPKTAADLRVDHVEGYEPQPYPALVNGKMVDPGAKPAGPNEYPKFLMVGGNPHIVNSYAEEMALSAPEDPEAAAQRLVDERAARRAALLAELESLDDDLPPASDPRAALLTEAKERGIRVHHKWGIDKLQEALKAA